MTARQAVGAVAVVAGMVVGLACPRKQQLRDCSKDPEYGQIALEGSAISGWSQDAAKGRDEALDDRGAKLLAEAPEHGLSSRDEDYDAGRVVARLTSDREVPAYHIKAGKASYYWVQRCGATWRAAIVSADSSGQLRTNMRRGQPAPEHVGRWVGWNKERASASTAQAAAADTVEPYTVQGLCSQCGTAWCRT